MHHRFASILTGLVVSLGCMTAEAAVIASDNFSYADGALVSGAAGVGWNGAWSGGGAVAGGSAVLHASSDTFRTLATPISAVAGNRVYVGFDLGASGAVNDSFSGMSFYSGNTEAVFLGGNAFYSMNVTGQFLGTTSVALDGSSAYVLAEILFTAANAFTISMYVDPIGALGVPDLSYTGRFIGGGSWDRVRLAAKSYPDPSNSPTGTFDNLVIGTELADVLRVPEPASLALVGIGFAGLAAARRRKPA